VPTFGIALSIAAANTAFRPMKWGAMKGEVELVSEVAVLGQQRLFFYAGVVISLPDNLKLASELASSGSKDTLIDACFEERSLWPSTD
jgi:hypothetical protein